jgi:hypothetical protein
MEISSVDAKMEAGVDTNIEVPSVYIHLAEHGAIPGVGIETGASKVSQVLCHKDGTFVKYV